MSSTPTSFGTTLSSGIQDISAILSLFGTEECELHVESALRGGGRGGYIYAAITPLSIFGSLGAAKAAFGILFASSSLFGARTLQNMGFEAKGDALAIAMLDGNRYKAESRLLELLSKHYVRSALHVSVERPAIPYHWPIPLPPWDLELLMTSVLVAYFGVTPYIHFLVLHHTSFPALAIFFPLCRVIGGLLCVFPGQWLLQYRIEKILRQRVLFKGINDLLNDHKSKMPAGVELLWDDAHASEACLASLHAFLKTPAARELEGTPVMEHLAQILHAPTPANSRAVAMQLKNSYLANTWAWFIMLPALLFGFLMTLAGYIGCFTIVQNSSAPSDTYIWLGIEAALALIRVIIWGLNPNWDDSDGVRLRVKPQRTPPPATLGNPAQKFKLLPERRFWEELTIHSGPVNIDEMKKIPEFRHSYSWIRGGAEPPRIILEGEGHPVLCTINNANNFDLEFHRADITSNPGHAVQMERLDVSQEFRDDVFHHYFFILSATNGDSVPIQASWPLSESSVNDKSTNVRQRRRRPRDLEQGPPGDGLPSPQTLGKLQAFVELTLKGTPLTYKEFSTSLEIVSDHSASRGLYQHISTYLSRHTKKICAEAPVSDWDLAHFYNKRWQIYSDGVLSLNRLFRPLNLNFVKRERDKGREVIIHTLNRSANATAFLGLGGASLTYTRTKSRTVEWTHHKGEMSLIDTVENVAFAQWNVNVLQPLSERLRMTSEVDRVRVFFMSRDLTRDDVRNMDLDVSRSLEHNKKAVEDNRKRAETDPAATADLVSSLHDLGFDLHVVGRHQDALRATETAVELRRRLAQKDTALTEDLARSLDELVADLPTSDYHEDRAEQEVFEPATESSGDPPGNLTGNPETQDSEQLQTATQEQNNMSDVAELDPSSMRPLSAPSISAASIQRPTRTVSLSETPATNQPVSHKNEAPKNVAGRDTNTNAALRGLNVLRNLIPGSVDNRRAGGHLNNTSHLYSRLLLPKRYGYPLFHPQPFDDLPPAMREVGTRIGDVGILTENGAFEPIFNILHRSDDPINRFGVPQGFEPVLLGGNDIRVIRLSHPPGSAISNTLLHKKRIDADVGNNVFLPAEPGAVVQVSTNSKETAILLLPDGASSWDVRSLKVFQDYASKHGQSWYNFVNGELGRMIKNDDLYLVTGVTKSTSWHIAVVENQSGDDTISLKLKATQLGSAGAAYAWESESTSPSVHSSPQPRAGEESWRDNQTLFLRGNRVSQRSTLLWRSPKLRVTSI